MNFKVISWRAKALLLFLLSSNNDKSQYEWINHLYFTLRQKCRKSQINQKARRIFHNWRKNKEKIIFQDPGTFGKVVRSTIHEVFRRTTKPYQQACKIAFLAHFIRARNILELGTAFGTTSLVIKLINPESNILTVEGVRELFILAQQTFYEGGIEIELLNMHFHEAIDRFEQEKRTFDFVFLDGHHEPVSSEKYLNKLIPLMSEKSIILIDDIFYNKAMYTWWKTFFPENFAIKITTWDAGILIKNHDFNCKLNFRWKIFL